MFFGIARKAAALIAWCALAAACASEAHAAVAFDAYSTNGAIVTTANPISWTHTPVGAPRAVIVSCVQETDTGDTIGTVTYGGMTMADVSLSPANNIGQTETGVVHTFFLGSSIPTGAQTVSAANTGSTDRQCFCVTLTAANDTSVVTTGKIDQLANGSVTGTLSLGGVSAFAMVTGYSGVGSAGITIPLAGWTLRADVDAGVNVFVVFTYDTVASADVTYGVTQSAGTDETLVLGVAVRENAGGGSAVPSRLLLGVF